MTTLADFSFTNTQILKYFKGSDSYVPTQELLYIHSHPLVKPNFLAEIEVMINHTSQVMAQKKMTGAPVTKFIQLATNLGVQLPVLNDTNATDVLRVLREVYVLCNTVTGKR